MRSIRLAIIRHPQVSSPTQLASNLGPGRENPASPERKDVSSLITPQTNAGTTGNCGHSGLPETGLYHMNAPKAQGAAGFFADYGKPVKLDSLTITVLTIALPTLLMS